MRERQTARIILLDPSHRVLLFRLDVEAIPGDGSSPRITRWIGPGGGIEPGESPLDAAHRELIEETGLRGLSLSEQIATFDYDIDVPGGDSLHVVHHVFVARMGDEVLDHSGMNDEELTVVTGFRWWTIEDLLAEQPDVRPPGFVELVAEVVSGVRSRIAEMCLRPPES
jgi:8-oxo-dGTP pyrophosphatase MutT (NUDIX family)